MIKARLQQLNKSIFGDIEDRQDRAILEERYRLLRGQLPITFGVFLTNVLGLYIATDRLEGFFDSPAWLLTLIVVVRGGTLLSRGAAGLSPEEIQREFKRGVIASTLYSLLFCRWALTLFAAGSSSEQSFVALVATLSSIGCAYGFNAFPLAGRVPLFLLGLPLGARLLFSGTMSHAGIALSLLLMILLMHRMLRAQSQVFKELVASRTLIADERLRAIAQTDAALAESANATKIAQTDPLTGLPNRRGLLVHLEHLSSKGCRDDQWVVLILVDLDGFKPINDTFGHAAGDAVLIEVAARLKTCARSGVACRLGGDEFAVLAITEQEAAGSSIAEAIRRALSEPYAVQGRELRLSACCGVMAERSRLSDPSLALSRSDMALYKAKQSGRNGVGLFSDEMEATRVRRSAIERALRDPDMQEQIGLAFQPIFDLDTMVPVAFEALARWQPHPLGEIPPAEFIRMAEQIDVMEAVGQRLMRKASSEAAQWQSPLKLAFNLSAIQLCSEAYARELLSIARANRLDTRRLQIEVTETALLADFDAARRSLDVFRGAGAEIVLDDFGAGYASVGYLRELEFDAVKLDGSLIDAALRSPAGERLMKGVVDLCRSLDVPCIAEHIHSAEALGVAVRLGSNFGQGYHLCPPSASVEAAIRFRGPEIARAA